MSTEPSDIICYKNDFARAWIEDKILCCEIKPNVYLNYHGARAVNHLRHHLQEGRNYPVFCDIRGIIEADEVARNFISIFGFTLVKAVSFLVTPGQVSNMKAYLKIYNIQATKFVAVDKEEAFKELAPYT